MSNPSVSKVRGRAKWTRRMLRRPTAFLVLFLILLTTALYSGTAAYTTSRGRRAERAVKGGSAPLGVAAARASQPGLLAALMPQAAPIETVTTYAADCATPKTAFSVGDTVCAKIEGGPALSVAPRRFGWVNQSGVIVKTLALTTLPQTDTFTIPSDNSSDHRGVWRVNS